ncbi:MAG: single-stranded-DNA-specific exonuclease RecJ [Flavobacteriaceae bacterium]|nr:single-stranded-DNA-specific exonuclease RecJ [Flavobacteriaceae bacterium]
MRWNLIPEPESAAVNQLSKDLDGLQPLLTKLLIQRGIDDYEKAKQFFRPNLKHLHDPFLMKDMTKAVERILQAIDHQEEIIIYGDYDVDGTCSVSMTYSFLKKIYPKVQTYIPDRYKEGYGISKQGIDYAAEQKATLIVALDCGIKAKDNIDYANKVGVDFIICDHHLPDEQVPKAVAVLDPKQQDCKYPFKELCGCGVGFKLLQALAQRMQLPENEVYELLDFVAVAICADIVPITGENRILTHFGLRKINEQPRPGFKALLQSLKRKVDVSEVVFVIAPRINAAGRMHHAEIAVNLLTASEDEVALAVAKQIEILNTDRRDTDQRITDEALQMIQELGDEKAFTSVVYASHWHKGVIGIVASRLIETYYRPTLVFTDSGDVLAASARSVKGFDIYKAIEQCKEHLIQFGGHKYAAGLTLRKEKYPDFKMHFEQVVQNQIDRALLVPELKIDLKIKPIEIETKTLRLLNKFGPFGPGNMRPVFLSENVEVIEKRLIGKEEQHLKFFINNGTSKTLEVIGFNMAEQAQNIQQGDLVHMVYNITENNWNGNSSIQLKLKDVQKAN